MENIFDQKANESILARLEKITAETKALWGKMSAAQMMWHCQKPIDVLTGKLLLKGGLLGFLFGKMAKNNFLKMKGFSKSSPTHPRFRSNDSPEFEKEKATLIAMVSALGKLGDESIMIDKHPFFGPMTNQEWGMLMYLHLDHHLKQFGA
ncbi:MAG: DUF1569 domain-containing protein [Flavobacterium sp.]|nr:MAG: DUF1569 domain-containing protein [Flavobacterium sp.]